MNLQEKFKLYYYLSKPGIVYGNSLSVVAGFFLGSDYNEFSVIRFVFCVVGLGLVMAGACVLNNIWDVEIDAKMERTSKRALVLGKITKYKAFLFASTLLFLGSTVLYFIAGHLAFWVAWVGVVFYVAFYTPLKKLSSHSTLVGAIAGAVPPVVGYAAASLSLDMGALIIFAILVLWQMPHFYAIGIFRLKDYASAGLPVLPVKSGSEATKLQILAYIFLFIPATWSLYVFGYTGIFYMLLMLFLSFAWLLLALKGLYKNVNETVWAKQVFLFSLIVLLGLCVIIPIDKYLNKLLL
ncbi:MAG: protoheme IX farnesyltransferase [Candidatus Doudnabacteria bacterium]|nr:protoheme IX farnesyltransferase [Candidatus Doudnabacteria bacterium]